MALANYTDLQASVASWLNRTDLSAIVPDFIALAEARISRDLRLRQQLTAGTLATVAGVQSVALPADFLEFENLSVLDGTVYRQITYVTSENLNTRYPSGDQSNTPRIFTIEGDSLLLGPTPDGIYTLAASHYAKFAALSTTPTNWLLTNHPSIYLYASLAEGANFLKDDAGVVKWLGRYNADATALQEANDKATHSGSALRVRAI